MSERLGLQRHPGSVATLDVGQWTSDPYRHRPSVALLVFFRCPDCGATYDIDAGDISVGGTVGAEFFCQSPRCDFVRFLKLEGWGEPVFDVSDIAKGIT